MTVLRPYPIDVTDEKWAFAAPYLTLMDPEPRQRWLQAGCFEAVANDLRSVLRVAKGKHEQPSSVILDGRTLQSTCDSGPRAAMTAISARRKANFTWRWICLATC